MLKVIIIHFFPDLQSPLISPLSNVPRSFPSEFQGQACQFSPVSTCSRSIGKSHWAKKWIWTNLLLADRGKNGKCHICMVQKTGGVNNWAMQMLHLPSLPQIYSSVFKILRHICQKQICAKSFFSSSE